MSVKSIENGSLTLSNLDVSTINNSVYPPVSGAGTLSDVLTAGNSAGNQSITGVNDIALKTLAYFRKKPTLGYILSKKNILRYNINVV